MTKRKYNCPGELTLGRISGKWKVIVLWLLRKGPQRSGKLKSRMPGISPAAFSLAVRELESDGLVLRHEKTGYPLQVSYGLSAKGQTLSPIVKSLVKWGLANGQEYRNGEFGMASFYR